LSIAPKDCSISASVFFGARSLQLVPLVGPVEKKTTGEDEHQQQEQHTQFGQRRPAADLTRI
jgi:hypothetical protein